MKYLAFFAAIAIFVCVNCKPPIFSEIPYIEFRSLEKIDNGKGYDDKAILSFYFEDGDGDIGLEGKVPDTLATDDDYNLFILYNEKQDGNFVLIKPNPPSNARIPPLSYSVPESISGIISIETVINHFSSIKYDTVRLDFYIVDRKKHKSNIATTGEFIVKKK